MPSGNNKIRTPQPSFHDNTENNILVARYIINFFLILPPGNRYLGVLEIMNEIFGLG